MFQVCRICRRFGGRRRLVIRPVGDHVWWSTEVTNRGRSLCKAMVSQPRTQNAYDDSTTVERFCDGGPVGGYIYDRMRKRVDETQFYMGVIVHYVFADASMVPLRRPLCVCSYN